MAMFSDQNSSSYDNMIQSAKKVNQMGGRKDYIRTVIWNIRADIQISTQCNDVAPGKALGLIALIC